MVISKSGILIRMPVKNINVIGRNTQGVRIMKLEQGDKVMGFAKIEADAANITDKDKVAGNSCAPADMSPKKN
jgi:DNA gyrase/topoisomerase IV subunit A